MLDTIAQDRTQTKLSIGDSLKIYNTDNDARNAAWREVGTLGANAKMFAAARYEQGGRTQFTLVVPFEELVDIVKLNSATSKDKTDVGDCLNRPLDNRHVKSIALYLENTQRYIIPPLTLNTRTSISVHANRGTNNCYIVLPEDSELYVTDGQHRIEAVKKAMKLKKDLASDGACVIIIQESDVDKIRQDFIDCSKTKPISRSLLSAFSSQDSHVTFVKNFIQHSNIFRGRVDCINSSVSKDTNILVTLALLTDVLGELIYGPMAKAQYNSKNDTLMPTSVEEEYFIDIANKFWEEYASNNENWYPLLTPGKNANIQSLRNGFIDFSSTGVRLISKIGYTILKQDIVNQKVLIKALAELDYQRTNPFWEGKLIISEGGETRPMACGGAHMDLVVIYVTRQLEKKTGIDLLD